MATDYETTFKRRAREYADACRAFPAARETERRLLVDLLGAGPGDVVLDHPAGSGYFTEGLERGEGGPTLLCAEPVLAFARHIPARFPRMLSGFTRFAVRSGAVDRMGSLAGLHHLQPFEKEAFFEEAFRVLRPGGVLAAADVRAGTRPALFLNGAVDRWSETGHQGMFFDEGELAELIRKAGFSEAEESLQEFTWDLPDLESLLSFAGSLFGLARASADNVRDELQRLFAVQIDDTGAHLPWALAYARGTKPR